jgi:prolyl-tRNA synthetase
MAAAVEQHHDADGIIWPLALAPFEIVLVCLNTADEDARRGADALYEALVKAGLEVLYDDRDERPGVKFKDADLLGFPIRVNVGGRSWKQGQVEIVTRRDRSVRAVAKEDSVRAVTELRQQLAASSVSHSGS